MINEAGFKTENSFASKFFKQYVKKSFSLGPTTAWPLEIFHILSGAHGAVNKHKQKTGDH